jgi:hypothetical protein
MKILDKIFKKGGMTYEQVFREDGVAIYRQTKQGESWELFEVGRIRQNKARDAFGKHFEASETWPSSEEWGIRAYTCATLARAKTVAFAMIATNSLNP